MSTRYATGLKRGVDLAIASVALVIAFPLAAVTGLLILLEDGPPVLYRQSRVGLAGQSFQLLKFRSMKRNEIPVSETGQVRADNPLVTRVGKVIRRLKIDELPQLLNVLAGDMSVVGPRPTMAEQVALYDEFARRRMSVRPGMTGWAQVNGNIELSWEERILLDVWYVDHLSPSLDFRILLKTLTVVALGEQPADHAVLVARQHAHDTRRSG